jgi:hypothetical protein
MLVMSTLDGIFCAAVQLAQAKEDNSRLRDRLRQSEEQGAPRRPPPREGEGPAFPPTEML